MSLSALIVDDDNKKAEEVAAALSTVGSFLSIVTVGDQISAKRELRQKVFDLVVLDIALPLREKEDPQRMGGLDLLNEVITRPEYKRPGHFVGLTAVTDVYEQAAAQFGNELWSVIFYDRSSDAWLEQLLAKARHIIAADVARNDNKEFQHDLCVVTALQDPELAAVLRIDWGWQKFEVPTDATIYHKGNFKRASGEQGTVVAARASGMGMSAAAVLAMKMIMQFRPRCLAICGICAGNKSDVQPGDLIVANPSWDYGSGKHAVRAKAPIFEPAPQPFSLSTRLRGAVERLQADAKVLGDIREGFQGQKPDAALRIHIGPLASGASVLANESLFDQVKEQNRKLLGVDMEGYGVMAAASEAPAPQPEAIVMKSVSDFADENKDDRFRHYAAYTSACALRLLAEQYAVRAKRWPWRKS
jgi:nucleoside phosphorylase